MIKNPELTDLKINGYSIVGDINPMITSILLHKRTRIHDFRHSCSSMLIDNGANTTLAPSI